MKKLLMIVSIALAGTLAAGAAWAEETPEMFKATVDNNGIQKVDMLAGNYFLSRTILSRS